jgi:hypothetical protein
MSQYKRIFDKNVVKHGQSAILYKSSNGERCPCFNEETGYGDPEYHRMNPLAPPCNDDGYINALQNPSELRAFIFPASDITRNGMEEVVLATIGQVRNDDYVYIGKSDIDIFHLGDSDYLEFDEQRWRIKNPDKYKHQNVELMYVARLELLGDA